MVQPLYDPDDRRRVQARMRQDRKQQGIAPSPELKELLLAIAENVLAVRKDRGIARDVPSTIAIDTAAATAALLEPHLAFLREHAMVAEVQFRALPPEAEVAVCVGTVAGRRCELRVAVR